MVILILLLNYKPPGSCGMEIQRENFIAFGSSSDIVREIVKMGLSVAVFARSDPF
jgi:hypothetical protein